MDQQQQEEWRRHPHDDLDDNEAISYKWTTFRGRHQQQQQQQQQAEISKKDIHML